MLSVIALSLALAGSIQTVELPAPPGGWGVYYTTTTANSVSGIELGRELKEHGSKIITIDIQTGYGKLAYDSQHPLSKDLDNVHVIYDDPMAMLDRYHELGYYVIARFVMFKQGNLAYERPDWMLKDKGTNIPYETREGRVWLDSSNPELRLYLIDIAKEIATLGFDEIQFDYVRFPSAGKGGKIYYSWGRDAEITRDESITEFVAMAAEELHKMGVPLSLDVFGIIAWNDLDWRLIGQNLPELAKHVDYLSPMGYPSHFGAGFAGYPDPGNQEYEITKVTMQKFITQTLNTGVRYRPWIQGFALGSNNFGGGYIENQVRALQELGIGEFIVWNARNDYWATMEADFDSE
jgi:hypothetical protein